MVLRALQGPAESREKMKEVSMPPAWERFHLVGPLSAFFGTVFDVIRAPLRFFEALPAHGPVLHVILFWAITTLPPMVVSGLQAHSFIQEVFSLTVTAPRPAQLIIPWWLFTVAAPLFQFLSLLGGLAVVHMLLQMMGHAHGGWSGSYRAGGYASGPAIFGFIPLIGVPLAGIWVAVLQFIALRRIHRVPTGILLLAYLLPVLAVLTLAVGIVLIIVAILSPGALSLFG